MNNILQKTIMVLSFPVFFLTVVFFVYWPTYVHAQANCSNVGSQFSCELEEGCEWDGGGEICIEAFDPEIDDPSDFPPEFPDDFDSSAIDSLPGLVSLFTLPFGGRLINTDYLSCSCGSVVLTIQDTRTQVPIRIVYIYALDLLKKFGLIPDEIPVPTVYLYYNIFTPGVQHLGRFIPVKGAPCLRIIPIPPYCTVSSSGGVGYLFDAGTSLIPGF